MGAAAEKEKGKRSYIWVAMIWRGISRDGEERPKGGFRVSVWKLGQSSAPFS